MSEVLSFMLPFKLHEDNRMPLFSASIGGSEHEFYMPSIPLWIEALLVISYVCMISALIGAVTYKVVVQKQGTRTAYIFGFFVLIPFWIALPFYGISVLDIRNKFTQFCFGAIVPTAGMFRVTEAIYGCVPTRYRGSLKSYMFYCGCVMPLQYVEKEKKHIKATMSDVLHHLSKFAIDLILLGALQSFVAPSHYEPFGSFADKPWYDTGRIFHPIQMGNTFVLAILFQLYLSVAGEGLLALTSLLTGYKCEPFMLNPLFLSTSPTEFWGKRWNRLIHYSLKRGAYVPLRKIGASRAVAATGAFLSSGLFHEWILLFLFQPRSFELTSDGSCVLPNCFRAPLGGSTAFMAWMAVVMMIEYAIGDSKPMIQFIQHVPKPVRTAMLIMIGLPVGHWFVEPYILSNYFDQLGMIVPLIKRVTPLSS